MIKRLAYFSFIYIYFLSFTAAKAQNCAKEKFFLTSPKNPTYSIEEVVNSNNCSDKTVKSASIPCEVELRMLMKGNCLFWSGDTSGAMLFFKHLAKNGSKHGAYAAARLHDPCFFRPAGVRVVGYSKDRPVRWYKKAIALGHKAARSRLEKVQGKSFYQVLEACD